MIASPLEPELAARIGSLEVVTELLYNPSLLPPARYPNDHAGDPAFARTPAQESRWNAMLSDADVIFGYPKESAAELARALTLGPDIAFVQGTSAGMGAHVRRANLPADVLARVAFASAAGVHAGMLAEFAFYGLLTLRKDAARLARIRAAREWTHYAMGELDGSTLAVVGMGQIGAAVAKRARAFGMRVLGVARTADPRPEADETYATTDIEAVFERSDAVVITLPMTDKTTKLVSAAALSKLRRSAIVVNVGRGSVVDQAALTAMLREGRLAGAVLDVFDPEPLPPDDLLWTLDNVIFSPHTAALSVHENERIAALFCDNLERFAAGKPLRNRIDLAEFY